MIAELNGLYELGLDSEPVMDRLCENVSKRTTFLVIGGSHAIREGESLKDLGYDVITCAVRGWRPNKSAVEDMTERVSEALLEISEDDIIVVHCFDNVVYMARSEEGGDLPIRRFPDGSYHIEGDLVLAGKERVLMYFRNCLPFLKLLEGRRVVFLTPLPRYLRGCCERSDHAANCQEEGFEEQLRKCLAECRGFYKDFLFTHGLSGFTIVNPGLCLPLREDNEDGTGVWGRDPVHPTKEGYSKIAELICEQAGRASGKKRAGSIIEPPSKKIRTDIPRPRWVDEGSSSSLIHGFQRGTGRGRGNDGGRGRGNEGGRGRRPWFRRPMRGGRF
jgi:hypothetical protein